MLFVKIVPRLTNMRMWPQVVGLEGPGEFSYTDHGRLWGWGEPHPVDPSHQPQALDKSPWSHRLPLCSTGGVSPGHPSCLLSPGLNGPSGARGLSLCKPSVGLITPFPEGG